MRPPPNAAVEPQAPGASPYLLWGIWLCWLFFLTQPLGEILSQPPTLQRSAKLAALALFVAIYLLLTWQGALRLSRPTPTDSHTMRSRQWWALIGLLIALTVILCITQGASSLGGFIYVSACVSGRLSARHVAQAIAALLALLILVGWLSATPLSIVLQTLFIVIAVAIVVYFFGRAIRINQELQLAREELARLAVANERLRFARDLHDLLGHTLSLIALKSELSARLIPTQPERAIAEIGDIETTARTALREVREAVAGYRVPTLASELHAASQLLAAAGIHLTLSVTPNPLPAPIEAALSWVIREGVTNVIRHSRAQHCAITITRHERQVCATITDDGHPATSIPTNTSAAPTTGSGLRGLSERLAALHGQLEVAAQPTGYRLSATLPLDTPAAPTSTPNAPLTAAHPLLTSLTSATPERTPAP